MANLLNRPAMGGGMPRQPMQPMQRPMGGMQRPMQRPNPNQALLQQLAARRPQAPPMGGMQRPGGMRPGGAPPPSPVRMPQAPRPPRPMETGPEGGGSIGPQRRPPRRPMGGARY